METGSTVKSVTKALDLLDRIALGDVARQGVALSVLAQEAGLPQNTAHNLLKSLIAAGYVTLLARGVYAAGPKCAQMARVAQIVDPDARRRVLAAMHRFVEAEGEACVCSILAAGERVTVAVVEGSHAVSVSRATIDGEPFWSKCTGRLLAATAGEAELRQVLARQGLPGERWHGIQDEPSLNAHLTDLREQGWSMVVDERHDLVAIACPIGGGPEPVWGTLAAYAPSYRCAADRREAILHRLRSVAADLHRELICPTED